MGTTLTAVVVKGEDLVIAHVGDSRAYLIRNGEMRQLTRDHTWVAEAMRAGTITPEEARTHANRHILTRALGADPDVTVDLVQEKLRSGDRVLLCSDGLTNLVSDAEILQQVQRLGPQKAPEGLVALANERGGHDNITALVMSVPGRTVGIGTTPPSYGRKAPWPLFGGMAAVLVVAALALVIERHGSGLATPAATSTPTPTPIATPPPMPTPTPTGMPTPTATATPTPTRTAALTRTPTPRPTSSPTPMARATATKTAPAPPITLLEPESGATPSGCVIFNWQWTGTLQTDEAYDLKVCQGEGCEARFGISNDPPPVPWNPKETRNNPDLLGNEGVYRWRVVVINQQSKQEKGPSSDIWQFTWTGGACGQPSEEKTKEKPPVGLP
jgi:hypothetical protein